MPLVAVLATSQMLCLSSESNAVAHTRCDKRIKMAHQLWGVCLHDPILTQVLLLCKCYAIVSVNRRRRLNGSTSTTQRCSESETQLPVYKKRIRRLYANKDQLATFDQNLLFSKPCEEVLKYKLPMMKKWCETTKQHFQKIIIIIIIITQLNLFQREADSLFLSTSSECSRHIFFAIDVVMFVAVQIVPEIFSSILHHALRVVIGGRPRFLPSRGSA